MKAHTLGKPAATTNSVSSLCLLLWIEEKIEKFCHHMVELLHTVDVVGDPRNNRRALVKSDATMGQCEELARPYPLL